MIYLVRRMRTVRFTNRIGYLGACLTLSFAIACSGSAQPPVTTPGRAMSIAVAPDDFGTLWTGTAHAVYRSLDGGQSWRRVRGSPGDGAISFARKRVVVTAPGGAWTGPFSGVGVRPMATPPADLVAVASPFYQTSRLYGLDSGGGLWVSVNGGRAWSPLRAHGLPGGCRALAARRAAETAPDTIYVACGAGGLWISRNFGLSFTRLAGLGATRAVATTPHDATRVLAAGPTGLWLSINDGRSFRHVLTNDRVTAVALDTRNWKNGFAGLADGTMLRSDDGGRTWDTG